MVPNTVMGQALLDAAAPSITVIAPAEIEDFAAEGMLGVLRLADGLMLSAPLVVGADGGIELRLWIDKPQDQALR